MLRVYKRMRTIYHCHMSCQWLSVSLMASQQLTLFQCVRDTGGTKRARITVKEDDSASSLGSTTEEEVSESDSEHPSSHHYPGNQTNNITVQKSNVLVNSIPSRSTPALAPVKEKWFLSLLLFSYCEQGYVQDT